MIQSTVVDTLKLDLEIGRVLLKQDLEFHLRRVFLNPLFVVTFFNKYQGSPQATWSLEWQLSTKSNMAKDAKQTVRDARRDEVLPMVSYYFVILRVSPSCKAVTLK